MTYIRYRLIAMIKMKKVLILILVAILCVADMAAARSTRELWRDANRGNVEAMRVLGRRLVQGEEGSKNVRYGVVWLQKAASKGDTSSMVMLGDLHRKGDCVAKNKNKAIELYEQAARNGNENAVKRLAAYAPESEYSGKKKSEEKSEPAPAPKADITHVDPANVPNPARGRDVPSAPGSAEVIQQFARQIAASAASRGMQSISVLTFQSNGGQSNNLTAHVRSLLLEELINKYSEKMELYDREDSKAVATESGFSMNGEQLTSSHALLVGEVFFAPGDTIGYISYRLFRATDTSIADAGYQSVKWDSHEQAMFNGSVTSPNNGSLPCIPPSELDKLANGLAPLKQTGVAMGQSGAFSKENTLQMRMAYAQIIPVLLKGNISLFEREFFLQAARETSLSNQEAMPGQPKAIGQLKEIRSGEGSNHYKLQVSAIPRGRLLRTINFNQKAGKLDVQNSSSSSASGQAHNGQNDFSNFMDSLDAKYRDVQLVYECEVLISNDYSVPEKYLKEDDSPSCSSWFRCDEDYGSNFESSAVTSAVIPARKLFEDKAREWYKESNGNRKVIADKLANAAMWGIETRNAEYKATCYAGPLSLCIIEVNKKVRMPEDGLVFCMHYHHPCNSLFSPGDFSRNTYRNIEKSIMQGTMEGRNGAAFHYSSSIEWKDGLPWKVKARIDLSPIKDKLLKKE